MTLGNWNLQRAKSPARRERLRREIDRQKADVWVFTETNSSFGLGADYPYRCDSAESRDGIPNLDQRDDCWVSIHSRFPLTKLATSDSIRTVAARVCPSGQAPFLVFGTVLPWIGSCWRNFPARGGAAFRAALAVQASDWKEMRRHSPDEELFVMGDFNQDLAPKHYYGSKENRAALKQALEDCCLKSLTSDEGDPIWRDSKPLACIDHICGSSPSRWRADPAVRWPAANSPDKRLSDHFGVAVTLEPNPANPPPLRSAANPNGFRQTTPNRGKVE